MKTTFLFVLLFSVSAFSFPRWQCYVDTSGESEFSGEFEINSMHYAMTKLCAVTSEELQNMTDREVKKERKSCMKTIKSQMRDYISNGLTTEEVIQLFEESLQDPLPMEKTKILKMGPKRATSRILSRLFYGKNRDFEFSSSEALTEDSYYSVMVPAEEVSLNIEDISSNFENSTDIELMENGDISLGRVYGWLGGKEITKVVIAFDREDNWGLFLYGLNSEGELELGQKLTGQIMPEQTELAFIQKYSRLMNLSGGNLDYEFEMDLYCSKIRSRGSRGSK